MSSWEDVAAKLAGIGLPAIGQLVGNMVVPVVGGSVGKAAGSFAASAVAAALGTHADPEAVASVIDADPSAAQVKLAQIDADSKQQLAALADMQSARGMETAAIQSGSKIQWVPVLFTCLSYLLLVGIIAAVMFGKLREDGIIVGYVLGSATTVFQYWFGSSSGSSGKDAIFQQIARTSTVSTPAPTVTASTAKALPAPGPAPGSNEDIIARASRL